MCDPHTVCIARSSPWAGDNGALQGDARARADAVLQVLQGCMLGVFIGDALGAGVEGWPAEEIEKFAHGRRLVVLV
jgi:hypothetical protein